MMSSRAKRGWKLGCTLAALAVLAIICSVWVIGLRLTRRAYVIPRATRLITQTPGEALGPGAIPASCLSSEGIYVPGWYRPGDTGAAIVFLHGLGGSRQQLAGIARRLHSEGWGVLLIDQRGHGEHPINITTYGRAEALDALAAVEWLRNRQEVNPKRVGLYGASMGGATCIQAASRDPDIACAVADSSYADYQDHLLFELVRDQAPVHVPAVLRPIAIRLFLHYEPRIIGEWADTPSPVDVVGGISSPLLLVQGENDKRINPDDVHRLGEAAREGGVDVTVWQAKGEEHCGYHGSEEFFTRLIHFFRMHL